MWNKTCRSWRSTIAFSIIIRWIDDNAWLWGAAGDGGGYNYVGSIDNINNQMMESLFDSSTHASNNESGNDDESDDSKGSPRSPHGAW
jgi:hypothetical protein